MYNKYFWMDGHTRMLKWSDGNFLPPVAGGGGETCGGDKEKPYKLVSSATIRSCVYV